MRVLLDMHRDLTPSRRSLAPAVATLLVTCAVLVLGVLRPIETEAIVNLTTSKVDLDVARESTATQTLVGSSRWVRSNQWRSFVAPTDCLPKPGVPTYSRLRHLRIDAVQGVEGAPPALGVGDACLSKAGIQVSYSKGTDESIVIRAADLSVPVAMTPGDVDFVDVGSGEANGDRTLFCRAEYDSVELLTNSLEFAPTGVIGPINSTKISFEEHELRVMTDSLNLQAAIANGGTEVLLSAVHGGSIEFPTIPSANTQIGEGDRVELEPYGKSIAVYLRPVKEGLKVTLRGKLAKLRLSGTDISPSVLAVLWNSPSLRLIFGAFSGVLGVLLAVLRWWD
jgi:hypothetical protein